MSGTNTMCQRSDAVRTTRVAIALCLAAVCGSAASAQSADAPLRLIPGKMPKVAKVDERFQSYNIEAVEVTGGRFWKPYANADAVKSPDATAPQGGQGVGLSGDMFQYREPINLSNRRLRTLAQGLAPAYVRVSGTWRNSTFFQDDDQPALKEVPAGFGNVLTRAEWKGVLDFASATSSKIITSFSTSAGTRDNGGVWASAQATKLMNYTHSLGAVIAAAEFMNEPTLAARGGGVPAGYGPPEFAHDSDVFRTWLRKESPATLFLGPGGEGEGMGWKQLSTMQRIPGAELLRATGPIYDVYSYHFYSAISSRCSALLGGGITPEQALSPDWLDIPERVNAFYAGVERQYMPGKPVWVTETGEAACGGDRWASTFLDTFRYLNELGTLARNGVQVVAHNTLAASDYALLDEDTFKPRPDYWAALLWRRLMGTTVLDAGKPVSSDLRQFAHCLPHVSGGVTALLINPGTQNRAVALSRPAEVYTLTATELDGKTILLNGVPLTLDASDQLPIIHGVLTERETRLPAHSITFLAFRTAANTACPAE